MLTFFRDQGALLKIFVCILGDSISQVTMFIATDRKGLLSEMTHG